MMVFFNNRTLFIIIVLLLELEIQPKYHISVLCSFNSLGDILPKPRPIGYHNPIVKTNASTTMVNWINKTVVEMLSC